MELLPKEIAGRLPPLYSQEERGDEAIAPVKFFTPWNRVTWYVSEYDPAERLCFGVVVGHEREFGYFSVDELEAIRGPGGLTIERAADHLPQPRSPRGTRRHLHHPAPPLPDAARRCPLPRGDG